VTIIDEAPQVINSNRKVKSEVVSMLEEMRKYGEGLILVCRHPAIGKDILRDTNQKIAHQLAEPGDVTAMAKMLQLKGGAADNIRQLPPGVAYVRVGTNAAALVRVRP
jgi:DNA helicase HerA-like ATPase